MNNSSITARAKYTDLFEQLSLPGLILDIQTLQVQAANLQAEQMFDNVSKLYLDELVEKDRMKDFQKALRKAKRNLFSQAFEISPIVKGKQKYLVLNICTMEVDKEEFIQVIIQDQTELIEAKRAVEELSITDAMTGLHNFRYFKLNLEQNFERSRRHTEDLSLILMDVDNFKHYNDRNGHPAGDKLLKELGEILKSSARTTDIVCRYGGEEFVILCPHTNAAEALILAERVREAVEKQPFDHAEHQPLGKVSLSLGISSAREHLISDVESMKNSADQALYEAKHGGRNQAKVYSPLKKVG